MLKPPGGCKQQFLVNGTGKIYGAFRVPTLFCYQSVVVVVGGVAVSTLIQNKLIDNSWIKDYVNNTERNFMVRKLALKVFYGNRKGMSNN